MSNRYRRYRPVPGSVLDGSDVLTVDRVVDRLNEQHAALDERKNAINGYPKVQTVRCELHSRIDRLQAIVGELPKCWRLNDAKTELVCDCPVVPGMTMYSIRVKCSCSGCQDGTRIAKYTPDSWESLMSWMDSSTYNTLEAAKFAKAKERSE